MPAENYPNPRDRVTPSRIFAAVTPSDTVDFTNWPAALYVGTGGDIVMKNQAGVSVTFKNVPSGSILDVSPARVLATGTTASDIVAL